MNRRQLLAVAGASAGGLVTAAATSEMWLPFGGTLRLGLAPVVPADDRAADRERVLAQLDTTLPLLVEPAVERAASEWELIRGLAHHRYDVVELGAVAGTAALEAGLVEPLVQPMLDGALEYEGRLLAATEDVPDLLPDDRWVAVGDPLATPTHAALARDSDDSVRTPPTRIRWHESPPWAALTDEAVALAASDEFHGPPDATVQLSYPMPTPALYVRSDVDDLNRLRKRFVRIEGGAAWYGDAHSPAGNGDPGWLGDAPEWLADVRLP
jgi:hypothetical protein